MARQLFLVCGVLAGISMVHWSAVAETDKPATVRASSSAVNQSNQQPSRTVVEECEEEWRANQEAMMKHDMDEDSHVAQCSVKDDVPALPSPPKTNFAPSPTPEIDPPARHGTLAADQLCASAKAGQFLAEPFPFKLEGNSQLVYRCSSMSLLIAVAAYC